LIDPVRTIASWPAVDIAPTASLREAALRLTEELVGVLVVADPRGLLGVVSERDLVAALAEGADPDVERVRDIMTDDVAKMDGEVTIREVAEAMSSSQIRHLLIVVDGQFAGIVSVRDILDVVVAELAAANGATVAAGGRVTP
jgi:CBS domain-containing protein